jgi:hypothetical protein
MTPTDRGIHAKELATEQLVVLLPWDFDPDSEEDMRLFKQAVRLFIESYK